MRLYKRNGIYHYSFTIDGQRYRKSSETTDKRLAEDIAHAHEAKIRRAAVHGPEAVLTFADALALYVDEGRDTRFLAPLLDHFGKTLVARITPPMLRDAAIKLYPAGFGRHPQPPGHHPGARRHQRRRRARPLPADPRQAVQDIARVKRPAANPRMDCALCRRRPRRWQAGAGSLRPVHLHHRRPHRPGADTDME
jgi:hypothetical protein